MRQKTARRWRAEEQSHTERLESLLQRVLSSPVIQINNDLLEEIRKEAQ